MRRPGASGAIQATCILIFLSVSLTSVYGTGSSRKRLIFKDDRQWESHPLKYVVVQCIVSGSYPLTGEELFIGVDCNPERCKLTCERHTQQDEVGLESAGCIGTKCICHYKKACNVSDCPQKCAREKFAKLSNRDNCYTRECFCLFDDRCEKRNCVEGCRGRGREGDGVKGVCIGSACSCKGRW